MIVVIAAIGAAWYFYATRNLITTDDAFTDGRAITIAPQVKGVVTELDITDNQFVHAGDVLLRIDDRDYVAARDAAKGQLDLARAQFEASKINAGVIAVTAPARLQQAQAQLASAKAQQVRADADYRRQHDINPAATTKQNVDQATAAAAQAAAQVADADAQVKQAAIVPQLIDQARAPIPENSAQIIQAQAQLDQAELNLSYTVIRAPQDGWITKRNVERGDYVQVGSSLLSIVTPQVWVTANFKETQLARMRPGDHVAITVDAYPSLKLSGHVDSIQLGTGSKFSAFPAENATGNYVKIVQRVPVKIIIDSGLDPNLPLPLGASVDPTVTVK